MKIVIRKPKLVPMPKLASVQHVGPFLSRPEWLTSMISTRDISHHWVAAFDERSIQNDRQIITFGLTCRWKVN